MPSHPLAAPRVAVLAIVLVLLTTTAAAGASASSLSSGPHRGTAASPSLVAEPLQGLAGDSIAVFGKGLPPKSDGQLRLGGVLLRGFRTGRLGNFSTTIVVPALPAGATLMTAVSGTTSASTAFTVLAPTAPAPTAPTEVSAPDPEPIPAEEPAPDPEPIPAEDPAPEPAPLPAPLVICSASISPGAGVAAAMARLRPGDTLCLRSGTYTGDIAGALPKGTAAAPIRLRSAPGEHAVIVGGATFVGADHWVISDLEFTNPGSLNPIVRILGGVGWTLERTEIHDGAYAGLLVARSSTAGVPHDYTIRHNAMHDTRASNLYHNPSRHSTGGLIERNLFFNSEAQNVKLGWGGTGVCTGSNYDNFGIGEVTLRYNTMANASQPLAIAESGGQRRVDVHHNLLVRGTRGYLVRIDDVEGCLGDNVWVHDNAGFGADRFAEDFGDQPVIMRQISATTFGIDPRFDSTTADGFHPTAPALAAFGRFGI